MNALPRNTTYAQDRWSYLWLFVGAGLLLFANGRWIIPLATWLAPVFLMRFARTQPAVRGLGLLLVTNVLASLFIWQGLIPPGGFYLPVASGIAVVFWLPYLADRLLVNRLPSFAATLVFPLLQVSLEYINTIASPFGSWSSLAYTQYSFLPFSPAALDYRDVGPQLPDCLAGSGGQWGLGAGLCVATGAHRPVDLWRYPGPGVVVWWRADGALSTPVSYLSSDIANPGCRSFQPFAHEKTCVPRGNNSWNWASACSNRAAGKRKPGPM